MTGSRMSEGTARNRNAEKRIVHRRGARCRERPVVSFKMSKGEKAREGRIDALLDAQRSTWCPQRSTDEQLARGYDALMELWGIARATKREHSKRRSYHKVK